MTRRALFLPLALATAVLAFPAASHGAITVLKDQENADPVQLVTFTKAAQCRKATKKKAFLKWIATAKSGGFTLRVDQFKSGLDLPAQFGGDSPFTFSVRGAGAWSSITRPPTGVPAGALKFNNKSKTRFGLGFSPAFDEGLGSTISVGGGLACQYPKKKKKKKKKR